MQDFTFFHRGGDKLLIVVVLLSADEVRQRKSAGWGPHHSPGDTDWEKRCRRYHKGVKLCTEIILPNSISKREVSKS